MLYQRAVHGICIGDGKGTSEEVYNTQGTDIPNWIDGITKLYHGIFDPLLGMPPESRVRHAIHLHSWSKACDERGHIVCPHHRRRARRSKYLQGLQEGWLQPSTSAWGTAILMVPKKDNTWRMCVDYRDLNASNDRRRVSPTTNR